MWLSLPIVQRRFNNRSPFNSNVRTGNVEVNSMSVNLWFFTCKMHKPRANVISAG